MDIYQAIIQAYHDVDNAHGNIHIFQCLSNFYERYERTFTEDFNKEIYTLEFVMVTLMLHDIGLSEQICKEVGIKGNVENPEWRRENHHINSSVIFSSLWSNEFPEDTFCAQIKKYGFNDIVNSEIKCMIGADAIFHHRASVTQHTTLEKFLRTCDGLNTAEDLIKRHVIHGIRVRGKTDFDSCLECVYDHLEKKYTGSNAYSKKLPLEWGNRVYESEIQRLKSFSKEKFESLAKEFFDEEMKN